MLNTPYGTTFVLLIQGSGLQRANVNFFYIKFEKVIFELFLILTKKERKYFLLRVCDCVNEELFMNKSCFLQPNYNTWFYTI